MVKWARGGFEGLDETAKVWSPVWQHQRLPWRLARKANFQTPSKTYQIQVFGDGAQQKGGESLV